MHLAELTADLADKRIVPTGADPVVARVRDDSRQVGAGDVFVAVRGLTVDGHDFVATAAARGAAAVVVERELPGLGIPQVVVPQAARALGWLAAREAGRPGDQLTMVGITGTNGKTTTTFVLESILAAAGHSPGIIGTVSYRYAGKTLAAPYTTPTALGLQALLADMLAAGVTHVIMEVSSAALDMDRLAGVQFKVGGFSNLTQDHLDLHGDMEGYFQAKARLFSEHLASDGSACVMVDGPYGQRMLDQVKGARRIRVTTGEGQADPSSVGVVRARSTLEGITGCIATPAGQVEVATGVLFGAYNLANLSLAVAIATALELPPDAIAAGIAALSGVPGRVERVANPRGLAVFVDYAHTPDALERVIAALRPLTSGRLICVFGCGGDRDPGKRPQMGEIAAEGADLAVVTSDNPRTEDPRQIIDMILPGMAKAHPREAPLVEVDRRRAIELAVQAARPGQDVVLIAGKGHEDYQILGTRKIHFDDREEAAAAIARLP
jgi:UDP-N-acetylmuramyl-tripeptide synthetase